MQVQLPAHAITMSKQVSVCGGYLFAKVTTVMGNPGLMLAGAGILIVVGVVVIPIYGGYKLYRRYSAKKAIRRQRERTRQQLYLA